MNVTAQAGDTLIWRGGQQHSTAADAKRSLRTTLRSVRKNIPQIQRLSAARAVARLCCGYAPLRRARRVAVYLSAHSELQTMPLIKALRARGIAVFAPAIVRGALRFRLLYPLRLARHPLGMQQPRKGIALRAAEMDVVVLPLLGFDAQGNRLGQGGGFYDRALSRARLRPHRLGLAYAAQACPLLPRESWDQALNAVLTERGIQRFHRTF